MLAIERSISKFYDSEEIEFERAQELKWAALGLGMAAVLCHLLASGVWPYFISGSAALALIGNSIHQHAFIALNKQNAMLRRELQSRGIYIGGEGRSIQLATDLADTPEAKAFDKAVGEWLRSPLPSERGGKRT